MIQRYVRRFPSLLDRIDIHIEVAALQYNELRGVVGGIGADTGSGVGGEGTSAYAVRAGRGSGLDAMVGLSEGGFAADICQSADEYAADTGLL
jgi:hypothetical protein